MVMTYEDKAMLKKRIMLRNVSFESKTASVRYVSNLVSLKSV